MLYAGLDLALDGRHWMLTPWTDLTVVHGVQRPLLDPTSLTLWDGTVRLPVEPSDEARFRLVVAECEEYLVDGENPFDRTPTTKGRRLVFVEHVELT